MQAFYFGSSASPLYGVLHLPQGNQHRNSSVLICHPVGHEYLRTYRMIRLLASRLSELGYYVLRFDYHGTGDSAGEFQGFDLQDWKEDIAAAYSELQMLSAAGQVIAIGVRIGALMLLSSSTRLAFNKLVLWDPCMSGKQYLTQLQALSSDMLASESFYPAPKSSDKLEQNELVGFLHSDSCLQQLNSLQVEDLDISSSTEYFFLSTENDAAVSNLSDSLVNSSMGSQYRRINDMGDWNAVDKIENSLTTVNIVEEICEYLN